jgi:CubicO group peptidase (beta-lactamase class C family)
VLNPATTLAEMMDVLTDLPLVYHPGTSWEYSVAIDVMARLVEIFSGQRFDTFIQSRILGPLGMVDTGFVVPEKSRSRLAAYYVPDAVCDSVDCGMLVAQLPEIIPVSRRPLAVEQTGRADDLGSGANAPAAELAI